MTRLGKASGLLWLTLLLLAVLCALLVGIDPADVFALQERVLHDPYVSGPVAPEDTTGMLPAGPLQLPVSGNQGERPLGNLPHHAENAGAAELQDPVVQASPGQNSMLAPLMNWEGLAAVNVGNVFPPDTNGQAGPNHFVQLVNAAGVGSQVRIWEKATGTQLHDFGMNNLWPVGSRCQIHGYGDPVVVYDQMAGRWVLTQFTYPPSGPYNECIAVSKTGVPTNDPNGWWLYTFDVQNSKFNDYPKIGVWPDGYYMSANQFTSFWAGAGVWVFERDKMLNGEPARLQYFDVWNLDPDYGGLLPSNLMGDTLPPTGAPNYFMSVDMDWTGADDILHVFEFHTDWNVPSNSTFTLVQDLVVAPFDWNFSGTNGAEVPQPGTSQGLDNLADRLMMHLWYRNYGDHESLVVNHTVDAGVNHHGVRWYEIRGGAVNTTLADASIYQQGTYAPDSLHRWMGSIAMDHVGNIAMGYSVSSNTVYPSIRYAGRMASDPLGTLPQAESRTSPVAVPRQARTLTGGAAGATTAPCRWTRWMTVRSGIPRSTSRPLVLVTGRVASRPSNSLTARLPLSCRSTKSRRRSALRLASF